MPEVSCPKRTDGTDKRVDETMKQVFELVVCINL